MPDPPSRDAVEPHEVVAIRVYEWATERLERDYRRFLLLFGAAALVATLGGLLTLPSFLQGRVNGAVEKAISDEASSFDRLRQASVANLAASNVSTAELKVRSAQLAIANEDLARQLKGIESAVAAIQSQNLETIASTLDAAKSLPKDTAQLLSLVDTVKQLEKRPKYQQTTCQDISHSNCNDSGWLQCPNGTFLAAVRNSGGSNACTSTIRCCQ
jgi:hypothetical protein